MSSKKYNRSYEKGSEKPFKLSRSKIDFYIECPRCFYLDRRLGVSRPSGAPFTLNVAVDALLKKEFDVHRYEGSKHPLFLKYGLDLLPFKHKDIDTWRENFVGIQFLHKSTNLLITGAVDDVWVNTEGMLHIVDYKATSKEGEINLEDTKWHNQYRRQMEIYEWLFRQNGFRVSDTGYFVYVNGKKDRKAFDGKLEFDVKVIPYTGSDTWIEAKLLDIKKCLDADTPPESSTDCEFCNYRQNAGKALFPFVGKKKKIVKNNEESPKLF